MLEKLTKMFVGKHVRVTTFKEGKELYSASGICKDIRPVPGTRNLFDVVLERQNIAFTPETFTLFSVEGELDGNHIIRREVKLTNQPAIEAMDPIPRGESPYRYDSDLHRTAVAGFLIMNDPREPDVLIIADPKTGARTKLTYHKS